MKPNRGGFRPLEYAAFATATLAAMLLCVCVGSVDLPPL